MANRSNTQVEEAPAVQTFTLRKAVRYLEDHGADVGEMRMRSLLRQNEIFTSDPNTRKGKAGDSEIEQWQVSQAALDAYLEARKNGTVRASTGAKAYKLLLTAEQFAKAREVLVAAGLPEPARLNKASSKGKTNGAAPAAEQHEDEDSLEAQLAEDDAE